MAIAGHFKMDIYTVSLVEKGITDSMLLSLFKTIPRGALVLMEDIDSAGTGREYLMAKKEQLQSKTAQSTSTPEGQKNKASEDQKSNTEDVKSAKTVIDSEGQNRKSTSEGKTDEGDKKSPPADSPPPPPSLVTLSGLLNAIDGVSAPEGHLLIMTSNRLEQLDEALIRPGRVDMRVEFEYASREQVEAMFLKMYKPINKKKPSYKVENLEALAKVFADRVPAGVCSPAKIQEYLIPKKVRPEEAVNEVESWIAANWSRKTPSSASQSGASIDGQPKASGVSRLFHGGTEQHAHQQFTDDSSYGYGDPCGNVDGTGLEDQNDNGSGRRW